MLSSEGALALAVDGGCYDAALDLGALVLERG